MDKAQIDKIAALPGIYPGSENVRELCRLAQIGLRVEERGDAGVEQALFDSMATENALSQELAAARTKIATLRAHRDTLQADRASMSSHEVVDHALQDPTTANAELRKLLYAVDKDRDRSDAKAREATERAEKAERSLATAQEGLRIAVQMNDTAKVEHARVVENAAKLAQDVMRLERERDEAHSEAHGAAKENQAMSDEIERLVRIVETPENARLNAVVDVMRGRIELALPLEDRVGAVLDELDVWIERAGAAERERDTLRTRLAALEAAMPTDEESACAWAVRNESVTSRQRDVLKEMLSRLDAARAKGGV